MMEIPNENTSFHEYVRYMKKYINKLQKNKYTLILKFINKYFEKYNINFKSLLCFKKISNNYFTNEQHNTEIMQLYADTISKSLNISYNEEINLEETIINFIKNMLSKIQYKLIKKTINNKLFYYIITTL